MYNYYCMKKGSHQSEEAKRLISIAGRGLKRSEITKAKMRLWIGPNNNSWIGDNVSYGGLHKWLRLHLPKPEVCPICKIKPVKDVANITGNYSRDDFKNWKWLCRSCHWTLDGKINNIRHMCHI